MLRNGSGWRSRAWLAVSVAVSAVAVTLFSTAACWGVPVYQVVGLGTLGGQHTDVAAINNNGQVVGVSDTNQTCPWGTVQHAFRWQNGTMTDIGVLPGDVHSRATNINDRGQITGESMQGGHNQGRAFLCDGATITDLGTLGGYEAHIFGINEQAQVAGAAWINSAFRALMWDNGQVTQLGSLRQSAGYTTSTAWGINNSGQIVGVSFTDLGVDHAFLWENGHMNDLGTLGSANTYSQARSINDSGQVVGWSNFQGREHRAFLWRAGVMAGICPLGIESHAYDINENNQVVGTWETADGYYDQKGQWVPTPETRAFLWENGIAVDLNSLIPPDSGWRLELALGINYQGQIVGQGYLGGQYRAYLLTAVPEPSSLAVLSVALAMGAGTRRLARKRG